MGGYGTYKAVKAISSMKNASNLAKAAKSSSGLLKMNLQFFAKVGGKTNPLENITYTQKVKEQMALGDYHSFPKSVDGFGDMGKVTSKAGRDGIVRTWVEIEGGYKGKDGIFQYIIEPSGICNHRLFIPK